MIFRLAILLSLAASVLLAGPAQAQEAAQRLPNGTIIVFDGRAIPSPPVLLSVREQYQLRLTWLEKKHEQLLPMMRRHGISMWIVLNEEFHDDPVTQYVAPPLVYTRQPDVHVFIDAGADGLKRYSNYWRPTLDYARFFQPLPVPRSERGVQDTQTGLRLLVERYDPKTIALDIGGERGQSGGLTHNGYRYLTKALGPEIAKRFVPAYDLIEDYFDTRLPEELEHYRALVLATDVLTQRALSNEVITPGKTRAVDVKWWFHDQIARLGVGATPWFEIHTAVQRFEPKAGKVIPYVHPAPDTLTFQHGDIIHLDCGFNYLGLASDWQKVAYILRPGETDVTPGMKVALKNGNIAQEAMRRAPRPGMTGREATVATLALLKGASFLPSLYSHPIGYQGHGLGANIDARNGVLDPVPARDSRLRLGSYRSIELSAKTAIPEWNGDSLLIPFEDDAHLTAAGYEWFRPPQTQWYLIR